MNELTKRQVQILQLLADGITTEEIPLKLGLSWYTIRAHIRYARSRLKARSIAHAIAIAFRKGIIK